jgi:hypothetical protein
VSKLVKDFEDSDNETSLAVPLEHLCDSANWGYVSEHLEPMPVPMATGDARDWVMTLGIVASHFRYKHYLSLQVPLTVLASPSVCETMAPYRSSVALYDLDIHSFGVERPQFALLVAERFRYFDRGDGYTARFTLPSPGALVDVIEDEA